MTPEQAVAVRPFDFSIREAIFLKTLAECGDDPDKAIEQLNEKTEWVRKLLKRLDISESRAESRHYYALAEKYVPKRIIGKFAAIAEGAEEPNETQKWGMEQLAKYAIPKQINNLSISTNVFQMPQMSPEQEKATREFFDALAIEEPNHAA